MEGRIDTYLPERALVDFYHESHGPDECGSVWPDIAMTDLPETIGPYRIVDLLGAGGMGVVYRAEDPATGKRVAVKTVRAAGQGMLASIRREIHALARVRHPGVVRITAEGVHDGLPWCAMELIEGVSLRDMLTAKAERDRVLALVARLCGSLAYLHGEGIVHCDLKPGNVIVREDGAPILVDLGLASNVVGAINREALDAVGDVGSGTIAYMAPERIQGELADPRADLYSLGCILYEIVAGQPPFVRQRPMEVAWAHLETAPRPLVDVAPDVSLELDALVMRLLAKRPADRIGYAADVAAALGAESADDGPRPRSYLYRPALAGREDALSRVQRLAARLEQGSGGLVLVGGESGVGKTRFVVEVGRMARIEGARILASECQQPAGSSGGASPLGSLRKILETIADRCRELGEPETEHLFGARVNVLAAYEPSLAGLPGADRHPWPPELPPAAARLRLFTALAEVLTAVSAGGTPLVVVLDDLQWADELTLGFLEFLVEGNRLEREPTLVVATYRTEEANATIERLIASDRAVAIDLERLDTADVASIVGDMLAIVPPPTVLSRYLARQSEGNPFFVAEYLRAAVDAGMLWRAPSGAWQVSDLGPKDSRHEVIALPGTLRELVERRLDALPDGARAVANAAAVLAREADSRMLARVASLDDAQTMDAVGELLRRHVFSEASPGLLRLAHDKLREVAYACVPAAARARLHGLAAEAIEALAERADFAALGVHWERSGDRARARQAYLSGARLAHDRYAHGEAERLFRSYIALADADDAERVRVRAEFAYDVLRLSGRGEEAADELEGAGADAHILGAVADEAECLRRLGCVLWELSRMDEARETFAAALALAAGDRRFEGITYGNLANVYLKQGDQDEALSLYERSLEVHREIGDRNGEAVKIGNIAIVHYNRGDFARARPLYEESIAILNEIGNRPAEAKMLGNLALLYSDAGDHEASGELFERALALTRDAGDRREQGIVLCNMAVNCQRRGRYDEALARNEQALGLLVETKTPNFEAVALNFRATLARQMGRLADAARSTERALAIQREVGDRRSVALALVEAGTQALARGEPAIGHVEEAEALAADLDLLDGSLIASNIETLRRAIAASAAGETLFRGERLADLETSFRRYLATTGELPDDSDS